ncbi:MAG: uroporphyrinogen-III C-methyltransferase [Bacteroidetes bacterium]|nr:uroporphyrinogen-III C-methyltransferase [Bacteroidota bacterium]
MHSVKHIGKVFLVGAGPGDPELLTLKALRHLQQADVVITDRLVSPVILSEYVREDALIIPVGKQCNSEASTPQTAINDLLVEHALLGRRVVRLKGGDVSIFSNVLDELQTLVSHGIPYELVPGVTAALGAAAYAGIPLTARKHAAAVRFLTAWRSDRIDVSYWQDLARTEDTLVFYMSSQPLDELVGRLVEYGIPADRWVAVIEQATTPQQRVTALPVHEYIAAAGGTQYASPSLIIIGKVAALHQAFGWKSDATEEQLYFPPVVEQQIKKKLVC